MPKNKKLQRKNITPDHHQNSTPPHYRQKLKRLKIHIFKQEIFNFAN